MRKLIYWASEIYLELVNKIIGVIARSDINKKSAQNFLLWLLLLRKIVDRRQILCLILCEIESTN